MRCISTDCHKCQWINSCPDACQSEKEPITEDEYKRIIKSLISRGKEGDE